MAFGVNPITPSPVVTTGRGAVGAGPQNLGNAGASQLNGSTANMAAISNNAGQKVPYYDQPQFDPRIYSLPFLDSTDSSFFSRGYMKWDKNYLLPGYSNVAAMHFLYNPTTITATYSTTSSDLNSALTMKTPADTAAPTFPMSQSVSFSLLFDRTFELWGSYQANGLPLGVKSSAAQTDPTTGAFMNDPTQAGVGVDILAMKQFTGMLASAPQGNGGQLTSRNVPQGPLIPAFAWLYFGSINGGQYYYGYVDSWDVTVTHWTQFMVPMRCAIDVDFTLLPPPAGESVTGNAAGNDQWWSLQALDTAVYNGVGTTGAGTTSTTITAAGKGGR